MKKRTAIIVDIDGTIAINTGRGHFDWDRVGEDIPNENVIKVIKRVRLEVDDVLFCTGRMEQCKTETERWIVFNVGIDATRLYMRPDDDFRKDNELKLEIYNKHIKDKYEILCVFDDRDQAVKMWREQGLTCLQVAEGDF